MEAGGIDFKGRWPVPAKDYGARLTELGFAKISDTGYSPQKGDIAVFQPYQGQDSNAGHIQMFNGQLWVSDFVQRHIGVYPGPSYRKEQVSYEIFRP